MSTTGDGPGLLIVAGRPVLRYRFSRQEAPTADEAVPLAPLEVVVPAVLDQLSGWWLASPDEALTGALRTAGATLVRHAHVYTFPLVGAEAAPVPVRPEPPPGLRIGPIDRPPAELVPLVLAAYPPDHVDHQGGDPAVEEAELRLLLGGELVGPLLAGASAQITSVTSGGGTGGGGTGGGGTGGGGTDEVVAAVIVNRSDGEPPLGGPWVSQVLRRPGPRWAGLGTLVLRHALAALAEAGEASLGLAVTDGNPARHVYERLGFRLVASHRKLAIP
ncbi:MAG: GNAT family N-acetyltransferase [Acidimicrobiales bacterium]